MKEQMKPIIMSTEDVLALLDGRKTMFRLVAKELDGVDILNCRHVDGDIQEPKGYPIGHVSLTERCKFKPGDVLWVRETWARLSEKEYLYQADDPDVNVWKIWRNKGVGAAYDRWMSPVTMPREAARLFLRVKDVRVERVQDIAEKDAESEGFRTECGPLSSCPTCNVSEFHKEWDSRNAKRGYGWDSNPFVWVISFERLE